MVRVLSKFHHKGKPKTLEEVAAALGFNAWKIADKTVDAMYGEGFDFSSKEQILDVNIEFVTFMLQAADRIAYDRMDDEQRQRFIATMAGRLINVVDDNMAALKGEGDHKTGFIETLNRRLDAYSEFKFPNGEPSYQALRFLGKCVDNAAGGKENKWILEQMIEIEAPELFQTLKKNMLALLEQSELAKPVDD